MASYRRKGGYNIRGAGGGRPRLGGSPLGRMGAKPRGSRFSERAALSRAAKGHGSYVKATTLGGREPFFTRRRVVTCLVVFAIAVALAVAVGLLVYQQAARNALKPVFNAQELAADFVTPEFDEDIYWNVLVHTDASSAEAGRGRLLSIALVCVDPDNVALTFFWIPVNTRVYIDGTGYCTVEEAFDRQHELGAVAAVRKLANIDIAHYMEINDAGLARLESLLAPLQVDPDDADQAMLVDAICRKLFGSSNEELSSRVDAFMTCVTTDATKEQVTKAFRALHGINIDTSCYQETMPTTMQEIDGNEYCVCNTDTWNTMVSRVASGMSPIASPSEVDVNNVTRDSCTVAVWNGVGVSGVGSDCTEELEKLGWNVISTGNAAQFVYDETFVIFKDTDDEAAARLLAADLGQGRVVRSYARYNYKGNLLVVIGKDYKPY